MFGKKTKEDMPRNSSQLDEWTDDLFKAFLKYRFYRFEESGFIRYMYKLDTMRKNLLVYEHANGLCGEREPEFYGTLIFGHNEPTVIKA